MSVIPNKEGTAFDTVTLDGGTVQSVSGQELTIDEGTKTLTYKTVTLTIPAGATVHRDGKTAQLGDLQKGDHAIVVANSDGTTTVNAADSSFMPADGLNGHFRPRRPRRPPRIGRTAPWRARKAKADDRLRRPLRRAPRAQREGIVARDLNARLSGSESRP